MTSDPPQLHRGSVSAASASSNTRSVQAGEPHSPEPTDLNHNKVIGACCSCRRSKVKCEHDGSSPCKRCRNGGYECTFKPREMGSAFLQDECRVKTDETLSKLVSAINALVQQETSRSEGKRRRMDDEFSDDGAQPSSAGRFAPGDSVHHAAITRGNQASHANNVSRRPSTIGWNGQPVISSSLTPQIEAFLGNVPGKQVSAGLDRSSYHACQEAVLVPRHFPANVVGNGVDSTNLMTSDLSSSIDTSHPIRAALRARGALPLPRTVETADFISRQILLNPPLLPRASRYRFPDASLGSNDPRLDAIRLGLLTSHEARSLFSLYAKAIEPFSFGFPDFPAAADLTPVLLSAIACVTSLHSPPAHLRALCLRLRTDFLDRTLPYAPSSAEDEFNPESGIGTEEVIGACIWASYEGGEEAWKVARAARWWSEKYSYASGPHAGLTVGELVAILPPVREVSMQDRVRVWLSASTTELHQCEIHEKDPIMELVDPVQYSQALLEDRSQMTKQDAGLVFYAQVGYLAAKARSISDVEELAGIAEEVTASWCSTRALLSTSPDSKDTYDHMIDLHYMLAKASILIRACHVVELRSGEISPRAGMSGSRSTLSGLSQDTRNACMDAIRLLMAPSAGFSSNMAALPSIYHHWIAKCLVFLIQLCRPEGLHYRLGLLPANQLDEILRTVGTLVQDYVSELSACSASIVVEEHERDGPAYEVIKHTATDAAMAVADMLTGVQAVA